VLITNHALADNVLGPFWIKVSDVAHKMWITAGPGDATDYSGNESTPCPDHKTTHGQHGYAHWHLPDFSSFIWVNAYEPKSDTYHSITTNRINAYFNAKYPSSRYTPEGEPNSSQNCYGYALYSGTYVGKKADCLFTNDYESATDWTDCTVLRGDDHSIMVYTHAEEPCTIYSSEKNELSAIYVAVWDIPDEPLGATEKFKLKN
jgi:hypothetical protein